MLRQLLTVGILFGIMSMLGVMAAPAAGALNPVSMAAFGFIVLAAYTLGDMAGRIRLPHITGYLVTGLICGPYILGLMDSQVVQDLKLFDTLAVALIGLSAGAALKLDFLSKNARVVFSVLGVQFVVVLLVVTGLAFVVVGPLGALPLSRPMGLAAALGAALMLATIAAAFSPAATIAVIHDTRSRGPITNTLLGVAVLNNVAVVMIFAMVHVAARNLAGETSTEAISSVLLLRIGGSVVLGITLGLVFTLFLRLVRAEILLFVVGAAFAVTFVADELAMEPVIAFIFAGLCVANLSGRAERLQEAVERVSRPVFVVFFFVAGASLHLDALAHMWPVALLLFGGRMLSLWAGTHLGSRLAGGPIGLRRYGWLGFGPQAGIALTLAMVVGHSFPGWGGTVETLAVAVIALNELFGPALLQLALTLVQETESVQDAIASATETHELPREKTPDEQPEDSGRGLPEWLPEPGRPHQERWGVLPATADRRLQDIAEGLREELLALVGDLRAGPVAQRRQQAVRFLGLLRREFLRAHRHSYLAANNIPDDMEWRQVLRREHADLATRWERLLLDRAATIDFRNEITTLHGMVKAIDNLPASLPEALEVPLEPEWMQAHPGDPIQLAFVRRVQLGRQRLLQALGNPRRLSRIADIRAAARYTLSGQLPVYLLESAGLMAMSERHLLARARSVFEAHHQAMMRFLDTEMSLGDRQARLDELREEVEEDFTLAGREVDRMADDTVRVTAAAVSRGHRTLTEMLTLTGTASLPARRYRFSRVFDARQDALLRLEEGLAASREITRGIAGGMAVELELVRLSNHVIDAVDQAADGLGRDVRGRITIQLGRVTAAILQTVAQLREVLEQPAPQRDAVRLAIQRATDPLAHVLSEALATGEKLRAALKNEGVLEPLLRALNGGMDELTDRFLLVPAPPAPRGRGLPERIPLQDLHFREAVRSFVDTEVGRALTLVIADVRQKAENAFRGIDEVERVLAFNADLAGAELEVLTDEQVQPATLQLLQDMLVGTLQRLAHRVKELETASQELEQVAAQGIRDAVTKNLDALTHILVEGRHDELRLRTAQEAMAVRGRELRGIYRDVKAALDQLGAALSVALGSETIAHLRAVFGLRNAVDQDGARLVFTSPAERVPIPTVYRRLFSDQALEAGDLLSGREKEVDRTRRILLGMGEGVSRGVAVVGMGGVRTPSVVQSLIRGLPPDGDRVVTVEFSHPATLAEVQERLLCHVGTGRSGIIVIQGFHWLFTIRPRGFEPLRAFLAGVVQDRGHHGWLVNADRATWTYARLVVPLEDAFPEQVQLGPLGVDELRRAILLRHAMSGYRLHFQRPSGHLGWWLKAAMSRKQAEEEIWESHFFDELHRASGGILSDALQLWLASIAAVGASTDTITIASMPEPPLDALGRLPQDDLLTLRQVARQGRICAADHAQQFRIEVNRSEGYLARLEHQGLLNRTPQGNYRFAPDLAGAIYQVLRQRGLVE